MSTLLSAFPVPVVRLILADDRKRILLLQRIGGAYAGAWCLPGGKVDHGETVEGAIRKELKEETDLELCSFCFLFLQDSLPTEPGGTHYLNLYFECQSTGIVTLNRESSRFIWLCRHEISQYKIAFDNDEALHRYWKHQV